MRGKKPNFHILCYNYSGVLVSVSICGSQAYSGYYFKGQTEYLYSGIIYVQQEKYGQMTTAHLETSFLNLEPVCCSMFSSNCCFLTCIQMSQEAGKVVWYFHLFKDLPQFFVIHTVKGFTIVNEAEADIFLEFLAFSRIQQMLAI